MSPRKKMKQNKITGRNKFQDLQAVRKCGFVPYQGVVSSCLKSVRNILVQSLSIVQDLKSESL